MAYLKWERGGLGHDAGDEAEPGEAAGPGSDGKGRGRQGTEYGCRGAPAKARAGEAGPGKLSDRAGSVALTADQASLLSWIESQCGVTRVWLDRLIAEGDPDDLVSLIHRQAAWLDLVRARMERG